VYKPVNCTANTGDFNCSGEASADTFPNPGPGIVPAGTPNLGAFDGSNQQGDWSLWIVTDCAHQVPPSINSFDSWTLTITNANPTAVKLVDLAGTRTASGIVVRWRTANESDVLGYNLWRVAAGKTAKLNRSLIVARASGRAAGAAYSVVDRAAVRRAAYTYRLQAVGRDGKRYWLGSTSLSAAS
jgi:hypothetical protein